MSKTTSKVLWILAGIFLIITGIGCLRNPGEILYGLPIIFGVAMMFSGIIDAVFALFTKFLYISIRIVLRNFLFIISAFYQSNHNSYPENPIFSILLLFHPTKS